MYTRGGREDGGGGDGGGRDTPGVSCRGGGGVNSSLVMEGTRVTNVPTGDEGDRFE